MSEKRRRWPYIVLGIMLAAAVAGAVIQTWRLDAAERAHAEEIAEKQEKILTAEKWAKSEAADRKEMTSKVAGLATELEAAHAAKAKVRVVTRVVTGEAEWEPPREVICPEPAAGVEARDRSASPDPLPPSVPAASTIAIAARIETALATTETGGPFLAVNVEARPRVGSWVGDWRTLPTDDVEVAHDPELQRALDAYRRKVSRLDLLLGASLDSDGTGYEVGVAGGGKRLGWYALGEYARRESQFDGYLSASRDFRVHGGLRLSLR